jgi:hypothetical protein
VDADRHGLHRDLRSANIPLVQQVLEHGDLRFASVDYTDQHSNSQRELGWISCDIQLYRPGLEDTQFQEKWTRRQKL